MSLSQWNTSFERKQLAKITTSLALYQANTGTSEMEEDVMSGSSSSQMTSCLARRRRQRHLHRYRHYRHHRHLIWNWIRLH